MKPPRATRASERYRSSASPPVRNQPFRFGTGATLAAIFCLALAVRLLHLWQIRAAPFFPVLLGDARSYDTWAQQIAAGDWIGREVFYQAPLYPYFLGLVYTLAGHDPVAVRIVQSCLGSIAVVLIAHSAWRLFSPRTGVVAGVIAAMYPPAIFFDGIVQKTALDGFLTSAALWIMTGLLTTRSHLVRWLALGVVMAALSLTRENALMLLAVLLFWCFFRRDPGRDTPAPSSQRFIQAAVFAGGVSIVLLPVAVRNYAVGGGFYLTTSQFGPNFYLGNNARTDGTAGSLIAGRGAAEYERQDAVDIAERAAGRRLTPAEVSSYWTDRALGFIRSQPMAWGKLMLRKTALLWNRAEAFDTESQESYAEWSMPIWLLQPIGHFGLLVPLAFFGAWVTWPDRRRLWILHAFALAYAVSVVLFFIYARYRFPLVPFLILFAAAGVTKASSWIRSHTLRQRIVAAAAVVALILFTNWPLLTADTRVVTEHNLGAALQDAGQLDAAIEHYSRAVSIDPSYAPSYTNMGAALLKKGEPIAAVKAYERALAAQPDFPDARFNLGNALLQQGNAAAAVEQFQIVARSSPEAVDVHTNLGIALVAVDRVDEGLAELRLAVQRAPNSVEAYRALGEVLAGLGRRGEARTHLARALSLDDRNGRTHYALGRLLLEEGRAAESIDHLRTAARLAPAPEILNDLGIALASSGSLHDAIEQFTRALQMDPGHTEARRNLQAATAEQSIPR